jgi:hypothetical protein
LDYLMHLYLPGALALWCALAFALSCLWGYSMVLRGDATGLVFARRAYVFFASSVGLAALLLVLLLTQRDFRIDYVFHYSGLDLPMHYQFAAFWAGQQGSFMIWLVWGSLLGLLLQRTAGKSEPAVMGVYLLTLLGLVFILVRQSPFAMRLDAPLDGQGLNPLLQDDWMVIHPPIMFVGFALSAIPFSFAMASLWTRRFDGWAARAFPWALGGFLVLGTAILMGGYWAYKTLGWGGYWGWDPVENASFIPFLFGTVLIHGLHMERTRGRYRRANYVLATLMFMSVLYGTFLTRSGVLADFSVHSFVDLGLSGWLVGILGTFMLLGGFLLATRLRQVPTRPNEDPVLSRGTFMVLATITLLVAALVILAGTSAAAHPLHEDPRPGRTILLQPRQPADRAARRLAARPGALSHLARRGAARRRPEAPLACHLLGRPDRGRRDLAGPQRAAPALRLPGRDGSREQPAEDPGQGVGRQRRAGRAWRRRPPRPDQCVRPRPRRGRRLPGPRRRRHHPARHPGLRRLRPQHEGDADPGSAAARGQHGHDPDLHPLHPQPGTQ